MANIAIIGAGIAGLSAARILSGKAEVAVFEKSRGVSGRLATRVAEPYQFNHGAQFFTARSKAFKAFLRPWIAQKIVQPWCPKVMTLKKGEPPYKRDWFEPHYTAIPKMTTLVRKLAQDQNLFLEKEIQKIEKEKERWSLVDAEGHKNGPFDWVIFTAPAPQTRMLMPPSFSESEVLEKVSMLPCFTLMIGFESRWPFAWQAARVKDSKIAWMAAQVEEKRTSLVVHSSHEWAESNLEKSKEFVQLCLLQELREVLKAKLPKHDFVTIHRWRYAATNVPAGRDYLIDTHQRLAACGDWCLGDCVESAFLSGVRLGKKIAAELTAIF